MACHDNFSSYLQQGCSFHVEGQALREKSDCETREVALQVYVFDQSGALLGSTEIDNNGNYSLSINLHRPVAVELLIGPAGEAQLLRLSSAHRKRFTAQEWHGRGRKYRLKHNVLIPLHVWRPWWPQRISITGHIRKVSQQDNSTNTRPIPHVKVELFDVDREACFWPWLCDRPDLLVDRPTVRIPELLKQPTIPERSVPLRKMAPVPGTFPDSTRVTGASRSEQESFNPSHETINSFTRVGEANMMDNAIATRLDSLTITSRVAPWYIFPGVYYSKSVVSETTTDCNGKFYCEFDWWSFHLRRGRLRFDSRPDILIKVTQTLNGITTVVYMDPYTSTCWNGNNVHLDLFLDNEEITCGNNHTYVPATGSPVFFTHIGNDDVYKIDQTTGLYNDSSSNDAAYSACLNIYGQLGDDLTRSDPSVDGTLPFFYYRLSYATQGSSEKVFKYINTTLTDTRIDKTTLTGQSHKLGPYDVNGVYSLYEVRNFNDYYWYNPEQLGIWHSLLAGNGAYLLRLEVFDKDGNKLNTSSGLVNYRNGAGIGNGILPTPLPPMLDRCDLLIMLDNKSQIAEISAPLASSDGDVIPLDSVLSRIGFSRTNTHENRGLRG